MRGILPEEILRKKKQGFGLPVSVWLRSEGPFKAMVRETLFDARARAPRLVAAGASSRGSSPQHERGALGLRRLPLPPVRARAVAAEVRRCFVRPVGRRPNVRCAS